jgi:hypothetical protein
MCSISRLIGGEKKVFLIHHHDDDAKKSFFSGESVKCEWNLSRIKADQT